jgi:serine/threonine-protein kinase RsbW
LEHVEQTFILSVPSDTRNLAMIRDFVEDAVRRSTMGGSDLDKLKLAVDEACANVIEHAYGNDRTKKLTIRVSFDPAQVIVDVVDSGKEYDPTAHTPATLEELAAGRRDGGMGIRIMRMATDELLWFPDEHGHNCLRLVKRITPPAAE